MRNFIGRITPHYCPGGLRVVSCSQWSQTPYSSAPLFKTRALRRVPASERSSRGKRRCMTPSSCADSKAVHDAELLRRFKGGDEVAFVEIVTRFRGRMNSIALSHLRNHADAEEITQDTFIRAHRGLARFRGDSSLATWLHRIAFNLSRNRCKYYSYRCRHSTLSLDCSLSDDKRATVSESIASDAPDPVREAMVGEFSALVNVCMDRLSPRQREILALRNG